MDVWYLMIDPRVVHNNRAKALFVKANRYGGETINFVDRMGEHKSKFKHAAELEMLFDMKENFIKEVIWVETFDYKGDHYAKEVVSIEKSWRKYGVYTH
uniref:Phage protein n=1 Tax=Rhabditophanes sp. KR3021 TaxID=114890 RepID=A0AC35TH10_9BILA